LKAKKKQKIEDEEKENEKKQKEMEDRIMEGQSARRAWMEKKEVGAKLFKIRKLPFLLFI